MFVQYCAFTKIIGEKWNLSKKLRVLILQLLKWSRWSTIIFKIKVSPLKIDLIYLIFFFDEIDKILKYKKFFIDV